MSQQFLGYYCQECGVALYGKRKKWCPEHKGKCNQCGKRRPNNAMCPECRPIRYCSRCGNPHTSNKSRCYNCEHPATPDYCKECGLFLGYWGDRQENFDRSLFCDKHARKCRICGCRMEPRVPQKCFTCETKEIWEPENFQKVDSGIDARELENKNGCDVADGVFIGPSKQYRTAEGFWNRARMELPF